MSVARQVKGPYGCTYQGHRGESAQGVGDHILSCALDAGCEAQDLIFTRYILALLGSHPAFLFHYLSLFEIEKFILCHFFVVSKGHRIREGRRK